MTTKTGRRRVLATAVGVCLSAVACTPALDWRQFEPEGSGVQVSFPCRPDRAARSVVVGGAVVRMEMLVCRAADTAFAIAFFDVAEPARVGAALAELRAMAVRNVQGSEPRISESNVMGMTPNHDAVRIVVTGQLPDGATIDEQAIFFAHGLRVYQATVIGKAPGQDAVDTFFTGMRFPG